MSKIEANRALAVHDVGLHMKVNWDDKKCIHSGNCVKTLPEVYMTAFVIEPQNASEEQKHGSQWVIPGNVLRMIAER